MTKILVTGANGFVGRALCAALSQAGYEVLAAVRQTIPEYSVPQVIVGSGATSIDWRKALQGVDTIIHLAARVHVMFDSANDPLTEFRKVNTVGTEHLARSSAASGVKRFVYVSTIGVNGLLTYENSKFCEESIANPHNPYSLSKWEAEEVLKKVASETGLDVVIVRPPLVYGLGAPGNFAQLISVLKRGLPLPFALVRNKRSLIYVGNLVDALLLCATHPAAAGQTYLVSDGEDLSTSDLLHNLSTLMGRSPRLFAFPTALLKLAGHLTGKSKQIEQLLCSLQLDSSKIRRELGWKPPFTLQEGLNKTIVR